MDIEKLKTVLKGWWTTYEEEYRYLIPSDELKKEKEMVEGFLREFAGMEDRIIELRREIKLMKAMAGKSTPYIPLENRQ